MACSQIQTGQLRLHKTIRGSFSVLHKYKYTYMIRRNVLQRFNIFHMNLYLPFGSITELTSFFHTQVIQTTLK